MKLAYKLLSWVLGRNLQSTPKNVILDQLSEKRPLPMGVSEFNDWSDRIISGAQCPATVESQKFTLAGMILHLGPTEAFKEDGYFINSLRKQACTEVAYAVITDIKTRRAAEQAAKSGADTQGQTGQNNAILGNSKV